LTLHATWSRIGHPPEIPVTGEHKSVKIPGAVELWQARFHYQQDTVFNASTYLAFLHHLAPHYRRPGSGGLPRRGKKLSVSEECRQGLTPLVQLPPEASEYRPPSCDQYRCS